MSLLGIEIGVTGCTAVVYATDGKVLGRATRGYPLAHPAPGAMELDARQVLAQVDDAIREAVGLAGARDPVRALAAAVQGEAVTPIDAAGLPLAPTLTTFDRRPGVVTAELVAKLGRERLQQITGLSPYPMFSLPKLLWWQEHHPSLLERAHAFVGFDGLLLRRLRVRPAMDYSLAGRTLALDLRQLTWSAEILAAAGLPPEKFPTLTEAGMPLGVLPNRVADALTLPRGVMVVLGGHDQACAALGCGAIDPGMAMDATGAVEVMAAVLAQPIITPGMLDGHYDCYPHVVPGRYLTLAYNFSAGSLLRWFRDTLGDAEVAEAQGTGMSFLDILVGKASSGPSEVLVLPHFTATGTPWLDPRARGAIIGLTLTTAKAEMLKGLLDSITYEMRLNLDRLHDAGVEVGELRALGGWAQSDKMLQLKADIFNRPVAGVEHADVACLGAAMLAGIGMGIYADAADAVARMVTVCHRAEPDRTCTDDYTRLYQIYARLYPALRPIMQALGER